MTADQRELIAAAVDGGLSATEERAFRLLLATSAQARQLYEKLQADSKRVRSLSRVAPPADLQTRILTKLAGATPPRKPNADPKPVHRAHAPSRRGLSAMAPFALAASVFLCLATASFLYLTRGTGVKDIAKTNWTNVLPGPQEGGAVGAAPATPTTDPVSVVRNTVSPVPPPVLPKPRDVVPDKSAFAIAPEPQPISRTLMFSCKGKASIISASRFDNLLLIFTKLQFFVSPYPFSHGNRPIAITARK